MLNPSGDTPDFELPDALVATAPPEAHGIPRDGVRLMVVRGSSITNSVFRQLGSFLERGDLLVVNTSATVAAATDAMRGDGTAVVVHVASPWQDDDWLVEVRRVDQRGPVRDLTPGEMITLAPGATLQLVAPWHDGARLWHARFTGDELLADWMRDHGRPIAYAHSGAPLPLATHQTVFARHPGSAEMPSAGRPFSVELIVDLMARGVGFAPILLHAGVSSLEAGELPPPERFRVGTSAARLINATRANGGRVIAVGTTVARAIESVAAGDGSVAPASGWTDLVLSRDRPARVLDGLVTGWHEPRSTHLMLLEAVAGSAAVRAAYSAALAEGYRWHEFGDSCLFLH